MAVEITKPVNQPLQHKRESMQDIELRRRIHTLLTEPGTIVTPIYLPDDNEAEIPPKIISVRRLRFFRPGTHTREEDWEPDEWNNKQLQDYES